MPKKGDKKVCQKCGTEQSAASTRTTSDAAFVAPGGAHPERIPDQYAWICAECGDEERVKCSDRFGSAIGPWPMSAQTIRSCPRGNSNSFSRGWVHHPRGQDQDPRGEQGYIGTRA
jgi:hypothetical protein